MNIKLDLKVLDIVQRLGQSAVPQHPTQGSTQLVIPESHISSTEVLESSGGTCWLLGFPFVSLLGLLTLSLYELATDSWGPFY